MSRSRYPDSGCRHVPPRAPKVRRVTWGGGGGDRKLGFLHKKFQRRTYAAQVGSVFAMKLVKAQFMVVLRKSRNKHH